MSHSLTPRSRAARALACTVLLGAAATLPASEDSADENPVRETLSRKIQIDHRSAAEVAAKRGGEVLEFEWRLGGFLGKLAGLFLPNQGDALLTFIPEPADDAMEVEVLITAPRKEGAYFLYGAEIEPDGDTTAVWSSYAYNDRRKDREQDLDQPDIIDFASAIYHLRRDPPQTAKRMSIWNDGKTYPVEVTPLGMQTRKVGAEKVSLWGFSIVGIQEEGEPYFDDKYFLYFDDHGTPTQIGGKRGLIRLRLDLVRARPSDVVVSRQGSVAGDAVAADWQSPPTP